MRPLWARAQVRRRGQLGPQFELERVDAVVGADCEFGCQRSGSREEKLARATSYRRRAPSRRGCGPSLLMSPVGGERRVLFELRKMGHEQHQQQLHRLAQAMCSVDLAESHWTQELPRLPVPDLWLTTNRYLGSLQAVLDPLEGQDYGASRPIGCGLDQQRLEANRRQLNRTRQLVHSFLLNEGPQLQRDLKEHANRCQNWATDYWLQDMYLSNPIPLPVNSNPFFLFPRQQFATSHQMLMFATRIIQFSVDFKCRIDQQTLSQDFGSGQGQGRPLCMETYKNFFHSYRMPHEDTDRLLPQSRRSNHIVVASCNQFYILRLGQDPLPDPYSLDTSQHLNEASTYEQLLRIYRSSRERAKRLNGNGNSTSNHLDYEANSIPKVGLFTTDNRKQWARNHKRLLHLHHANGESLRQIEDCLFVMCLDSLVDDHHQKQQQQHQDKDVMAANLILTGAGCHLFTANRWFDKFLQIIVGRDGVCGINIEHSASEGITVLRFLEEFLQYIKVNPIAVKQVSSTNYLQKLGETGTGESITSPAYVEPLSPNTLLKQSDNITPLEWHLDQELQANLAEAETKVDALIANFSLHILRFNHFGRTFIKQQQFSPDAFVQLALQFTFYKLHGQLVSTYESASLRQFRLGRVDNIRANTCEAYDWIQTMLECKAKGDGTWSQAEPLFVKAITKQVEILRYTITGSGPDNHLLALRQLANIRYDDEPPELFSDPSYKEFINFRLSTSQLPNESGITVGYGAVVPDGYGCSYNPCESSIIFCVSCFADCPETSSTTFAATLEESLLEMQQLCLGRKQQPAS